MGSEMCIRDRNLRAIVSQRLVPTVDGGRAAAVEVMLVTPYIQSLIQEGEVHEIKAAMEKGADTGMQTFDQALFDLYEDDAITYDDAMRYADSMNELRLRIKLEGKAARDSDSMSGLDHLALEETEEDGGAIR